MAHPQTNFNPPFNVTRASHLVFTVRDLAASKAFYTEVIGLKVSAEDDSTLWLHGIEERCHHSLTLKKIPGEPSCERVGFRVFDDADLEKAKAHFDSSGTPARFVHVPFQGRTLHVDDSTGTPLELVARMPTHVRAQTYTHTHKGASDSYYIYLRDPDGHRIELLLPATQIIDIDDEPMRYNVMSGRNNILWGLPPPRSWFEETTPFAGARVMRPPQEGEPSTLEQYLFAKRPAAAAE